MIGSVSGPLLVVFVFQVAGSSIRTYMVGWYLPRIIWFFL